MPYMSKGGSGAAERSEAVKKITQWRVVESGWGLVRGPVGTPTPRGVGVEKIE